MEEVQKELDLATWQTSYEVTNNSLGKTLDLVRKRAYGDKGKMIQPLLNEVLAPASKVREHICIHTNTLKKTGKANINRNMNAYVKNEKRHRSTQFLACTP
jgi:hypothetical protein